MPLIDYVSPEEAPQRVRDALANSAYADSEDRHLFYEMLANVPSVFESRIDYFGNLMGSGKVPRREKELAYLTVALVTDTRFVAATHARYLVDDHEVPEELITALATGDTSSFSDRDQAVISFAQQIVYDPSLVSEDDVARLHDVSFDEEAIVELLLLSCEAQSATTIVAATGMSLSDRGETEPRYLPAEFDL